MKRIASLLSLVLSLIVLGNAETLAGVADREIASVAQLQATGADWSAFPVLHLESYYAGGGVGGGDFARMTCTPDGGNCLADGSVAAHTFKRINPHWDASEYGFVGDHTTDNSAKMVSLLAGAVTAGVKTVTISQNGQYYFATGISVPAYETVNCLSARSDQAEDTSGIPTGDHKDYPYTLLIPASATITLGPSNGVSASMSGCNVENKAVYDTPNPTTLQSLYNITGNGTNAGAFGGVGVTGGGDGSKFEKGLILGFTTAYKSVGHDSPQLNEVYIDATNCIDLETSQFIVGLFQNFGCYPILTERLRTGNDNQNLPIDSIAASPTTPANYRLHLASPCVTGSGNCPLTGNAVWIGFPVTNTTPIGVESVAGQCTFKYIDDSNFECTNSQATATVTTGTTVANSTRICGITTLTYVRNLQQVSGTGIPGSDTVVAVAPREGCVWMALPATASGTIANLTFTDNAYSGSSLWNLRPWADSRFGIGMALTSVNSFKFQACEVYTHTIAYQLNSGDGNTFSGCGAHDQANNLDTTHIGLDLENGTKGNIWLGGTIDYGGNQATAILSNINAGTAKLAPNYVVSHEVGQSNLANIILDSVTGSIVADISSGEAVTTGDIFVATAANSTILDHYFGKGVTVRVQDAGAESRLYGCNTIDLSGSVYCNPGSATNLVTAFAGGGQTNATITSTDFIRVNVAANNGDSIMLRPAIAGRCQTIANDSAHNIQVFGYLQSADTINDITSSTGVTQASKTTEIYCSVATGNAFAITSYIQAAYNHSGVVQPIGHAVYDIGTLSGGSLTITLAGASAFTNSTSYTCFANDQSGSAVTASISNTSGTQFIIHGTGTDGVSYFCTGS